MKQIYQILLFIALVFAGTNVCNAQYSGFDSSIHAIRGNALPQFRYKYDDYLQYSPAAAMMIMKASGYESRSSWSRMLVSDAFSTAIMAVAVNGLKYTVQRPRPDASRNNSFPSGHTATAFMTAAMLHKEYSWQRPLISIGGYTVAALTGVSRILNNKHWVTDVAAGAAIGIGSVHLGYYITDLLFKNRGLAGSYMKPAFDYDDSEKHFAAELLFGYRFVLGNGDRSKPSDGGTAAFSADIPLRPELGIKVNVSANSLSWPDDSSNMYGVKAGGYWNVLFARRFEFQTNVMAGYAWIPSVKMHETVSGGIDLSTGISLGYMLDNNFRLKVFADFESVSVSLSRLWINSVVIGWSSAWVW